MKNMRQMANRLRWLLEHKETGADYVRNQMGYAKEEWRKLLEGRLMPTVMDIQGIASALHVPVEDLYRYPQGESIDPVHCSGTPTDEAKDYILDIFDMVCDLREAADGTNGN